MNRGQENAKAAMLRDLVSAGLKPEVDLGALPAIAHILAEAGWQKPEPLTSLKGKATIMDLADPQADLYIVYGFDGFGHSVKLEQTGHHPAAALERAIVKYGAGSPTSIPGVERQTPRYDPMWVAQVLAVHGDTTMFWAEAI